MGPRAGARGEKVILKVRQHWVVLVPAVLLWFLVVSASTAAWLSMPPKWGAVPRWGVVAALGLVAVVGCVRPFLSWLSWSFILTEGRVMTRSGVLARRGRDIPLIRVNDVSFQQSLLGRLFGLGRVVIESGGEGGQMVLERIARPERVAETVQAALEAAVRAERREPWR